MNICPVFILFSSRAFESLVSPWSLHHSHPSSGGILGSPAAMEYYLGMVQDEYDRLKDDGESPPSSFDEQSSLRRLHLAHYPAVKVDSLAWVMNRRDEKVNEL